MTTPTLSDESTLCWLVGRREAAFGRSSKQQNLSPCQPPEHCATSIHRHFDLSLATRHQPAFVYVVSEQTAISLPPKLNKGRGTKRANPCHITPQQKPLPLPLPLPMPMAKPALAESESKQTPMHPSNPNSSSGPVDTPLWVGCFSTVLGDGSKRQGLARQPKSSTRDSPALHPRTF